jgi:eukaryotic-like serine/threonine-protein kinase
MIEKIGRYEIRRELGKGGMATVYLAYDPHVQREVAVKLLPPEFLQDASLLERFKREARVIAALEHPAIVPLYDFGEHAEQLYFVMRYMAGGSLTDCLQEGSLSLPQIAGILERIGSALDHAHRQGVVHRDLKPANILFDQYGNAYLGDFGIARLSEAEMTLTGGAHIGTPAYMSPEQALARKDLDGRSDIYALGVILFELLTGQKPYTADTPMGVALMHVTSPVPRVREVKPDLSPELDTLISKAMAKDPECRFSTAGELLAALAEAAGDKHDVSLHISQPVAKEQPTQKNKLALPLLVGIVALCSLLSFSAAAFWYGARDNSFLLLVAPTATRTATATMTVAPTASATQVAATMTATATPMPTATATPSRTLTSTLPPTAVRPSPTLAVLPIPTLAPTLTATKTMTARPPTVTPTRLPATATIAPPPSQPTDPPLPPPTPVPVPTDPPTPIPVPTDPPTPIPVPTPTPDPFAP